MTERDEREVVRGIFILVGSIMREADLKVIQMLNHGNGSMQSLIDTASEYVWDHILDEPKSPTPKKIANTIAEARTHFDRSVRLLGQYFWREAQAPTAHPFLSAPDVFRVYENEVSAPGMRLALALDGRWALVSARPSKESAKTGKPGGRGRYSELERYLKSVQPKRPL